MISGACVDALIGGTGNDLFYVSFGSPGGTAMTGGRRDEHASRRLSGRHLADQHQRHANIAACDLTGKALNSETYLDTSQPSPNVTLIAGCGSLQRRGRQHHGTLPRLSPTDAADVPPTASGPTASTQRPAF